MAFPRPPAGSSATYCMSHPPQRATHPLRSLPALIGARRWPRWVLQIMFAALVSVVEAVGALLILFLLGNITQSGNRLVLPVAGDLQRRFPAVSEQRLFAYVSAGIGVFFLVRAAMLITQSWLQNRLVYEAGADLSDRLFRMYLSRDLAWHLQRNSAELIRNTYESVNQIVGNVFIPIVAVASDGLIVIAVLTVLFVKAPVVTAGALAVLAPLIIALLRGLQPRYTRIGAVNQETSRQGLQILQQSFAGLRDIKVAGAEAYFESAFRAVRGRQSRAMSLRALMLDIPRPVVESTVILLILGFLAWQRVSGSSTQTSLALLGLFAYAVLRLMPSLNRIVANFGVIRFGGAAIDHVIDDVRDLESAERLADALPAPTRRPSPVPLQDRLVVDDVWLRYPERDRPALQGVSLQIARGESLGVVGPTGCGKTTLIDVITGVLTPDHGSVSVGGVDIRSQLRGWQASLGLVPQSIFIVDDTLRRNIAFGVTDAEIDEVALQDAVRLAHLEHFVAELRDGLDTMVGERGVRLSGGQRQRVAIARALYHKPSVLLFDEGTAALDNLTEAELVSELDLLRGARTIITVAHRLTTVRRCDRIVVMDSGRIVDVGPWGELMARSASFRRLASEPQHEPAPG
jgi:ATP-binding cassette, subfamily B, bacterial PglK